MTECVCGDAMPVSLAVLNDGLCRHCMGIEMAQDAAIERSIDERGGR
jgi:hypothetical protein